MVDVQDIQKVDLSADVGELEAVSDQVREQESAESKASSVVDETIPEKYRGMSVKDLAEKLEVQGKDLGRYTNELGEVRRLADELIKSTLHKPKEQEVSNEIDFFENPQEAMRQTIERNPVVQQTAQYAYEAQKALTQQKLYQLHPDADDLLSEQGFKDFVAKSPVRQQLLQDAHYNYNLSAANELFSTYKELRGVRQSQVSEVEKSSRDRAMTAASVDTGGSGEKTKKIINRRKIMDLMLHDRKAYEAMQDEILLAYAEGRVR